MYNPKSFFNIEVLEEVLSDYDWPSKYTLEKVGAGNVKVHFSGCTIIFSEGFESKMNAYFLNSEIGREPNKASLHITEAVNYFRQLEEKEFNPPTGLIRFLSVEPSEQKVKDGLNNLCILIQAYLMQCIQGDFNWVKDFQS